MNNISLDINKDKDKKHCYYLKKFDTDNIYKHVFPNMEWYAKLILFLSKYKSNKLPTVTVTCDMELIKNRLGFLHFIPNYDSSEHLIYDILNTELFSISVKTKKEKFNLFPSIIVKEDICEIDMHIYTYQALLLYIANVEKNL